MTRHEIDVLTNTSDEEVAYFRKIAATIVSLGDEAIVGFDSALTASHQETNLYFGEFIERFGRNYNLPEHLAILLESIPSPFQTSILGMNTASLKNKIRIREIVEVPE